MVRPQPLSRAPELPVTAGLVGIAIIVGIPQQLLKYDVSRLLLTDAAFWSEPWRLVTSILPHGDPLHLLFNLYWVWVFGAILETRFGHLVTLGMVLVFAVGSGAAEFATGVGGIGLSGVNYGFFGVLYAMSRKDRQLMDVMDRDTVQLFVIWFFVCIGLTYAEIMPIANFAHGMGAFLGVAMGLAVAKPPHGWPTAQRWVPWLGALGLLLGVVLPVVGAWRFRPQLVFGDGAGQEAALKGQIAFHRGDFEEALVGYRRATELDPDNTDYWYNVGVTHERLEQWAEAAAAYEQAVTVAPTNRQAWSALAGARLRAGDEKGALEAMARADALRAGPAGAGEAGSAKGSGGGAGDEAAR